MKKIKFVTTLFCVTSILTFTLFSCEQSEDSVGYGLLNQGEAGAVKRYLEVLAYNLFNNDSVRSDEDVLSRAIVGSFTDDIFGKVKAAYTTQIRLPYLAPVFSDSIENGLPKASVDSVVLYFTPAFSTKTDEIEIDTLFTDQNGALYDQNSEDEVDTFRIITKYPIINKYGNSNTNMTLNVHTINEFLYSIDSTFYSNKSITDQDLLGSASITDYVVGVEFKNSKSVGLDSINGVDVVNITPSIRIPLDVDFFQNNIINKQGQNELTDQSRFIRFIKGIKLSVEEDNAFMLSIDPSALSLNMYISYTKKRNDEGTIVESNSVLSFSLNNQYNVRVGLFDRDASLSPYLSPYTAGGNISTGDAQLFLDGLGGFKNMVKINDDELNNLKTEFNNSGKSIVGAKLRFYKDPLGDGLEDASTILAYKYKNDGALPILVSDIDNSECGFIQDVYAFSGLLGYNFNPVFDSETNYYDINITQYVKDIVEKDSLNYPLVIQMGDFIRNSSGSLININLTNYPFNPFRQVFKGSALQNDEERLRLQILYTEN